MGTWLVFALAFVLWGMLGVVVTACFYAVIRRIADNWSSMHDNSAKEVTPDA